MPTWDEITPHLDRETATRRWNAVNVIMLANIVGFILPGIVLFAKAASFPDFLTFQYELGIRKLWLWQFFTYTFWHPIGVGGGNEGLIFAIFWLAMGCWFLHRQGRELEAEWGWKRFTVFYLAAGAYGAVLHAFYQLAAHAQAEAFGFYGPTVAVYLVWALKYPNTRTHLFFFELRAITWALILVGIAVLFCFAGFHAGFAPIASLGTIGSAYLIHKAEPKIDAWLDSREQRSARERFLDEFELKRQVDALLDKINREGIGSLSSQERKLLKRASRLYSEEEERRG